MATSDPRKTGFQIAPFLGTFAWASAPSASASGIGATFRASDVGISPGMRFVSDGTRWIPDGAQILGRSGVASSVTGTVSETALATVVVPAGAMGLNGGLLVKSAWNYTNSANNKVLRVRFGAGLAGTAIYQSTLTTTASLSDERRIRNRNNASSQVSSLAAATNGGFGTSTAAMTTAAINTAAAADVVLSGTLANTGETITLEQYEVWLTP